MSHPNPYEEGLKLMDTGNLSDAALGTPTEDSLIADNKHKNSIRGSRSTELAPHRGVATARAHPGREREGRLCDPRASTRRARGPVQYGDQPGSLLRSFCCR